MTDTRRLQQINPRLAAALVDGARRGRVEAKALRAGTDPADSELEQLRAELEAAQRDRHRAWKVHRALVEQLAKDQDRIQRVDTVLASWSSRLFASQARELFADVQAALDGPAVPAQETHAGPCYVCGAAGVVYRNYRGLLFCHDCATCECGQAPCTRTADSPSAPAEEQLVGDECPRCDQDTAACLCDLGTPTEQLDEDDVYQPDPPIRCGIVTVADTPVRVTGGRELTDLDRKHLAEVIRAAKRLYAAEHPEATDR